MKKKTAIVDIDDTLWDLTSVLHSELLKLNPNMPNPKNCKDWDFYKEFCSKDEFESIVMNIHLRQNEFLPFEYSAKITKTLIDAGYHVIIASHRNPTSTNATLRWLNDHDIQFSDVYFQLGGKEDLCKAHEVYMFIDDSPITIQKILNNGIDILAIEYEYNKGISADTVHYCKNDKHLYESVLSLVASKRACEERADVYGPKGRNFTKLIKIYEEGLNELKTWHSCGVYTHLTCVGCYVEEILKKGLKDG